MPRFHCGSGGGSGRSGLTWWFAASVAAEVGSSVPQSRSGSGCAEVGERNLMYECRSNERALVPIRHHAQLMKYAKEPKNWSIQTLAACPYNRYDGSNRKINCRLSRV